ncbi:right-handed parallel beta-helix repeat-containing protein [Novosphingobium sp. 9]|uniref:right-handed parallel beta-helix repeat-containing protein n=1 Tax=Novosphingobium sp. 9 TaxID=2025349 RepID=UPI0021B566DF|nr:right-handed parallel beta-helix repeat-containing protein [Novosphingobium sp. 9]
MRIPLPPRASGLLVLIPVALVSTASVAQQAQAAYTVVESGRSYARLQDAVDAIGDGRGTIRFASMRFADCAVQTKGDVTYRAAVPGQSVLDGVPCEGKAALVLRGRSARIEGLVFADIRVPDHNGAGVRLESGNLTVSQSWFRDSEQGVLSADDPQGSITIDKSTFTRLGTCEGSGGCAHGLYIGNYGSLTVTRSRFEAGTGGHYFKSRAARVTIENCSFDDSQGKGTNYMIDLPEGATGRIADNWFVQGRDKENYSAFIAVAAEHHTHSADGLTIVDNNARFAPGIDRRSAFVADWSGDALKIGANTLGPGLVRFEKR